MTWEEQKRPLEAVGRFFSAPKAQEARPSAVKRVHLVFAAVQSMRLGELALPVELTKRLVDVVLRQPNQAEQPMQAQCWIAIATTNLAILDSGPLTEDRFGLRETSPGDMDHCRLKICKREIGVERERVRCGS